MESLILLGARIIVHCEGVEFLIEVKPPHSNGSFCPSNNDIEITCTGVEAPVVLEWFVNGTNVADYLFRTIHTYPRSPDNVVDTAIIVNIRKAIRVSLSLINITSIISGNFTTLSGSTIQWGSDIIRSNPVLVEAYMPQDINIMLTAKLIIGSDLLCISLLWELVGLVQCRKEYMYRIAVKENSTTEVTSINVNCLAAKDQRQCMADIILPPHVLSPRYIVEITQATLSINVTRIIDLPEVRATPRPVTVPPPLNCPSSNTYSLELIIGSVIGSFILALFLGIVFGIPCGFKLLHITTKKKSNTNSHPSNHSLNLSKGPLYEEVEMKKNVTLTQNICYDIAKKS